MKKIMLFLFIIFSFLFSFLKAEAKELEVFLPSTEITVNNNVDNDITGQIKEIKIEVDKTYYLSSTKKQNNFGLPFVFHNESIYKKSEFLNFMYAEKFKTFGLLSNKILELLQAFPRAP